MSKNLEILVADDDRAMLTVIEEALSRKGHTVRATDSGSRLWTWVEEGAGDLVISDIVMPDADGLDLLDRIRRTRPELPVILISARNTLTTAVQVAQRGAYDYLPKPFDLNKLTDIVENIISKRSDALSRVRDARKDDNPLIGQSAAMQGVFRTMARVMQTDLTVLIHGESGTGKELVARALHDMGPRGRGPFVPVNLAAIPRDLIENELFGHEKGAFTGASSRERGRFEDAQGGSLFLDEIGDMPYEAQTRLLRVLQQREFRPVGGRKPIKVDVRVIAATNRDIEALIVDKIFRQDLYYRLNVIALTVPPLRQRADDILPLVEAFAKRAAAEGLPRKGYSKGAIKRLQAHSWPGNVRELENLVRRAAALQTDDVISAKGVDELLQGAQQVGGGVQPGANGLADAVERQLEGYFSAHDKQLPPEGLYQRVLEEVERPLLRLSLAATRGNQLKAAALLGINRNTLRKKLKALGMSSPKDR